MRNHILLIRPAQSQIGLALVMVIITVFGAWFNAKADESLPSSIPDFPSVIRAHSAQLAKMESDKGAINLFVSAIGPSLQLGDVARTLGANPLPAMLAKELLVPDLTAAVLRLMGDLAAWHLASTIRQAVRDQQFAAMTERLFGSPQARAWLDQQGKAPWHGLTESTLRRGCLPRMGQGESGRICIVPIGNSLRASYSLGSGRHASQLPGVGPDTELEGSGAWAPRTGQAVRDLAVDRS